MGPNISLSPRQLAVAVGAVALGGGVGTLIRDLALKFEHIPDPRVVVVNGFNSSHHLLSWTTQIPWTLLVINVLGAYLATYLLRGPLRHRDPNDRHRLLVITGLLGGFTSYSGLFVDLAAVWHLSAAGGLLVALGALASGVAAAGLGLAGHRHR